MKTPDIHPQQLPLQQVDPHKDQTDLSHQQRYRPNDPVHERTAYEVDQTPSRDRIRLNMQERAKARFQELSYQIHNINQTMETVDAHLGEMRVSLETIVKHYPPFPPESAERIESLRQFSTLRKIIDQLSTPRQADSVENLFKDRKSPFGKDGLDIPELGPDAGDDQILTTLNKVKTAQIVHQKRHHAFLDEVNQAFDRIG